MMMRDDIYHTMGDWPLLKCVSEAGRENFLREMHEGLFGAHIGVSALIRKVILAHIAAGSKRNGAILS